MGIVIGETAEVGDDCLIYHGVTLGGTGKDQGKRHPTIGNNVLLSTGSKVLGPFKVGDGARIAANAVVLKEVPEDATAVGVPARVVRIAGEKTNFVGDVDQVSVPDPVQKELDVIVHPHNVKKLKMDGRVVEHAVVRSINVFIASYLMVFALSVLLISLDNFDFTTNFTAVAATINNIGPGLGMVGPTGNFSQFSDFSKLVLTFDMLAGRLELFPLLIVFAKNTWSK